MKTNETIFYVVGQVQLKVLDDTGKFIQPSFDEIKASLAAPFYGDNPMLALYRTFDEAQFNAVLDMEKESHYYSAIFEVTLKNEEVYFPNTPSAKYQFLRRPLSKLNMLSASLAYVDACFEKVMLNVHEETPIEHVAKQFLPAADKLVMLLGGAIGVLGGYVGWGVVGAIIAGGAGGYIASKLGEKFQPNKAKVFSPLDDRASEYADAESQDSAESKANPPQLTPLQSLARSGGLRTPSPTRVDVNAIGNRVAKQRLS